MLTIHKNNIIVNQSPKNKSQAMEILANKMEELGLVKHGYHESMLTRDNDVTVYLENGIAIPHGDRADEDLILETGIVVMSVPQGVDWGDGDKATLLFGICAKGDEHLNILTNIAKLLPKTDIIELLVSSNNPEIVAKYLSKDDEEVPQTMTTSVINDSKFIVGITACPTGVAHTYMAADTLKDTGTKMGWTIRIETQGSSGAKSILTDEEIAKADAVVIAADTNVDLGRFNGKKIIMKGTKDAIHNAEDLLRESLTSTVQSGDTNTKKDGSSDQASLGDVYKHLMTGVSYMLPFVVAGGILIAISFIFGIHSADQKGSIGAYLMEIGGNSAFKLMIPILAGYIAYSISGRSALAPGAIGGYIALNSGAGFLGGIIAGFIAGYIVWLIVKFIILPRVLESLMPTLIIPVLSVLAVGLIMIYVVSIPVAHINTWLTHYLKNMGTANGIILGVIVGLMMCFDLGGPVNKAAYAFGTGLLGEHVYAPMAAIMAAGMVPPLAAALATVLSPKSFNENERGGAAIATAILGLAFISEGAIPYAAKNPLKIIPSFMIGGAITGALSFAFGNQLLAPHGGLFVMLIPHAVIHPFTYALAILIGVLVSAFIMTILFKLNFKKKHQA